MPHLLFAPSSWHTAKQSIYSWISGICQMDKGTDWRKFRVKILFGNIFNVICWWQILKNWNDLINLWWHLFLVIYRSKENSLSNTQLIFLTEKKLFSHQFCLTASESNKAFIIIKNAKLTLFWGSYFTFIMIDFVWNSYFKKMNSNGICGEN